MAPPPEEEDPEEVELWVPSSDSEPDADSPALEPPDSSPSAAETVLQPARMAVQEEKGEGEEARPRWPGWPGASVFRLLVPADKVGGLIGRRGSTIKRLCDETRARVRVLAAAHAAADRIVLVSATEEVEAELSPAMNAAIKIFKHINGIEEINSEGTLSASSSEICSVRLLVPAAQAVHLIGMQGVTIKSIQESTGATIRIIDENELLSFEALDERIMKIYGASLKVHNALKSVLGLLCKFLVDHGVLHLFERKNQEVAQAQDASKENQLIGAYHVAVNQDFWLSDQPGYGTPIGSRQLCGHDPSFCDPYSSDIIHATDSLMTQPGHANPKGSRFLYGCSPSFCDQYSPYLRQPTDTLITQTMKIPLPRAEEIIGERGENIEFVRSVSGAVVILEEIGDYSEEVLIVIKGSPSQVQTAHQRLQEALSGNREPPRPPRICYRGAEAGPRLPSTLHAGVMLLNSPHAGPRWLHSPLPHAVTASQDYLPWHHEDEPPVATGDTLPTKITVATTGRSKARLGLCSLTPSV